jgi:hypothetical protein
MTADADSPGTSRGVQREVAAPDGRTYLVQVVPSGYVEWSPGAAQGPVGLVGHTVVTWLLHRLAFRGGWTVVAWQRDRFAPKRTRVVRHRYRDRTRALAAYEELASTIARSGPPSG